MCHSCPKLPNALNLPCWGTRNNINDGPTFQQASMGHENRCLSFERPPNSLCRAQKAQSNVCPFCCSSNGGPWVPLLNNVAIQCGPKVPQGSPEKGPVSWMTRSAQKCYVLAIFGSQIPFLAFRWAFSSLDTPLDHVPALSSPCGIVRCFP